MSFKREDQVVTLHGINSSHFHSQGDNDNWELDQAYMLNSNQQGALWSLNLQDMDNGSKTEQDVALTQLLQQFIDVFEEPKSLPPSRACDHTITLQ